MSDRPEVLTTAEVLVLLRISRTTLYGLRKSQGFPEPLAAFGSLRWLGSDIDAWLNAQSTLSA